MPEGCGFEIRQGEWIFSMYLILLAEETCFCGVESAAGVYDLPPSSKQFRQCRMLIISQPHWPHRHVIAIAFTVLYLTHLLSSKTHCEPVYALVYSIVMESSSFCAVCLCYESYTMCAIVNTSVSFHWVPHSNFCLDTGHPDQNFCSANNTY
jgi:hypothetical protein